MTTDSERERRITIEDRTIAVPNGSLRARMHLDRDAPLALAAPGLSANSLTFDRVGSVLAEAGRKLVALDLRGRGRSPAGAPGTHGWEAHARDVLAVADSLGVERFDFLGHSMGAFVGLVLMRLAPSRVRRLVLIDAVGVPDPRAMPPIYAAAQRLGLVHASADAFLAKVRAAGVVPWDSFWEAHYREDLVEVPSGVRQRAEPRAIMEDLAYASVTDVRRFWPSATSQTLLVRAAVPLATGGDIVTAEDRDAFLRTAPRASVVEIDANHYGVMSHPATARAINHFLI